MKLIEDMSELQKMLNYVVVKKSKRLSGIFSIIFGLLAMALGVYSIKENPINIILAALGLFLVVEGIWLIANPSRLGVLVDGIALVVLACWNIGVSILNLMGGGAENGGGRGFILGIVQLAIAGSEFARYKSLDKWPAGIPSDMSIENAMKMLQETIKADSANEPDIIIFNTADSVRRSVWKVRLYENAALVVESKMFMASILNKDEFNIESKNPSQNKKNLKTVFKIGKKQLKGTISQDNFAKYAEWKKN